MTVFKKHYEVSAQEEQLLDTSRVLMLELVSHSLRHSVESPTLPLPLDEVTRYRRHTTSLVCINIDPLQLVEEDRAVRSLLLAAALRTPCVLLWRVARSWCCGWCSTCCWAKCSPTRGFSRPCRTGTPRYCPR
jgi:hypothetical protein